MAITDLAQGRPSGGSPPPSDVALQPFLRWAGGKRWLLPSLRKLVNGRRFSTYYEPFLGGGAVFFGLPCSERNILADSNKELIDTYKTIREQPLAVSKALESHRNTRRHYESIRSCEPKDPAERAARFIFLNHTSFNGLYRVNLRGEYNVPWGDRPNPRVPELKMLNAASARLSTATLWSVDFEDSLAEVREGDLVYLDPPYTVSHNENGFIKYNSTLFSPNDQERLSQVVSRIRAVGAFYALSNAHHSWVRRLFDFGDLIIELDRRNSMGGRGAERGRASEYLFTNLVQHE